ncbi:MAG: hypothetical protein JNL25_10915 [Rhodospirillaceae bacterium]|nr:hypothetical protein [Rhodospirillaceae bacterium]
MNRIASYHLRAAAAYGVLGMLWGAYMASVQDHLMFPAHGHLSLLGWVSVMLFGLFFLIRPAAAEESLAPLQLWSTHVGIVLFVPGLALTVNGLAIGMTMLAIGALGLIISAVSFAWIVFRHTHVR